MIITYTFLDVFTGAGSSLTLASNGVNGDLRNGDPNSPSTDDGFTKGELLGIRGDRPGEYIADAIVEV
jgi:hypothetical protein